MCVCVCLPTGTTGLRSRELFLAVPCKKENMLQQLNWTIQYGGHSICLLEILKIIYF